MDPARNQRPRWLPAAFLALLAGLAAPGRSAGDPAGSELRDRGEEVMRRFCLACHGSPGGKPEDPLGPRLRPEVWGSPERAYEAVGQLGRVNRRMDQPFPGTDAERRALAEWLSWRAQENRARPFREAAAWTAAGAFLLAASLLLVRARRRGARSR